VGAVKCDRRYPVCTNCKDRKEDCDLTDLHPDKKHKIEERGRQDAEKISRLELQLAQLQNQLRTPTASPGSSVLDLSPSPSEATTLVEINPTPTASSSRVGYNSLDWRLATPQMAKSLSQHLCDAFYESCCFLMPSFSYFRTHLPRFADPNGPLPRGGQAAIGAFLVIGARASPHSALLGLPASGTGAEAHPKVDSSRADSLSAGARRQTACLTLFQRAHQAGFDSDVSDEANAENLATVLALFQMSHFNELGSKKSRALVRAAVAHYRELQDAAVDEGRPDEALELKRMFGLAVYSADAITAAYTRRASILSMHDVETYFSDVGIVMPNLPDDDLGGVLRTLGESGQPQVVKFQMANHLSYCWTAAAQRMFAQLVAPSNSTKTIEFLQHGFLALWSAVDTTRAALLGLQQTMRDYEATDPHHQHHHSRADNGTGHLHHEHEHDYSLQSIRTDRDLLDLDALSFDFLKRARRPELAGLLREAEARVRRDLKRSAFYFHIYANAPDEHMVFHHVSQLEHNPDWTRMALQRVGEAGGPVAYDEELTEEEVEWMVDGLGRACFYTPVAEKRLRELRPDSPGKVEELDDEGVRLGSRVAVAALGMDRNASGAELSYGEQAVKQGSVAAGLGIDGGVRVQAGCGGYPAGYDPYQPLQGRAWDGY